MATTSPGNEGLVTHLPPQTTKRIHDVEKAGEASLNEDSVFLQVIDAAYQGSIPQLRAAIRDEEEVSERLKGLPPQETGTARIFNVTIHSDCSITGRLDTEEPMINEKSRSCFLEYLNNIYAHRFPESRIFNSFETFIANDIGSISAQWSQGVSPNDSHLYHIINHSTLKQRPLDHDIEPRSSYMTCVQEVDNDQLIVVIVNEAPSAQTVDMKFRKKGYPDHIQYQNPHCISSLMAGTSLTSLAGGSRRAFTKLLVLDFFLASVYIQPVDYYQALIYPEISKENEVMLSLSKSPHLRVPIGLFEPTPWNATIGEPLKDIEATEAILRTLDSLMESIRFVVAALKSSGSTDTFQDASLREERDIRLQAVERLCFERLNNTQKALQYLNRHLDYMTKILAIHEANSMKLLTIIACLYLPFSLSAAVLSIQSPFKKIVHTESPDEQELFGTNLLFDFFGLFVALAAATIVIVFAIRLTGRIRSSFRDLVSKNFKGSFKVFDYGKGWRFSGRGGYAFEVTRLVIVWWAVGGLCIVLPLVFMVGMLRTSDNAWSTAKSLFAMYAAILGSLICCYVGTYTYLYNKYLR